MGRSADVRVGKRTWRREALCALGLVGGYVVAHWGAAGGVHVSPVTAEQWRFWAIAGGGIALIIVRAFGIRRALWWIGAGVTASAGAVLVLKRKVDIEVWDMQQFALIAGAIGASIAGASMWTVHVSRAAPGLQGPVMLAAVGGLTSALMALTNGGAYISAGLIGGGMALSIGVIALVSMWRGKSVDHTLVLTFAVLIFGLLLTETAAWAELEPQQAWVCAASPLLVAVRWVPGISGRKAWLRMVIGTVAAASPAVVLVAMAAAKQELPY